VDALNANVQTLNLIYINESAVTLNWLMKWDHSLWGPAYSFEVEISFGPNAEDFLYLGLVDANYVSGGNINAYYTVVNLTPQATYRFRVIPIFNQGRGRASNPIVVTTLATTVNFWEPLLPRRVNLQGSGRGFTNPVLQRPHLSVGVQTLAQNTSVNALRYSDPLTKDTPVTPSSRRGQTLTLIDNFVYMFGGSTDGQMT
jgi:hypothetical protein